MLVLSKVFARLEALHPIPMLGRISMAQLRDGIAS